MTPDNRATIKGWLGRDKSGLLRLYDKPPRRHARRYLTSLLDGGTALTLNPGLFPSVTWEGGLVQVELTINIINQ